MSETPNLIREYEPWPGDSFNESLIFARTKADNDECAYRVWIGQEGKDRFPIIIHPNMTDGAFFAAIETSLKGTQWEEIIELVKNTSRPVETTKEKKPVDAQRENARVKQLIVDILLQVACIVPNLSHPEFLSRLEITQDELPDLHAKPPVTPRAYAEALADLLIRNGNQIVRIGDTLWHMSNNVNIYRGSYSTRTDNIAEFVAAASNDSFHTSQWAYNRYVQTTSGQRSSWQNNDPVAQARQERERNRILLHDVLSRRLPQTTQMAAIDIDRFFESRRDYSDWRYSFNSLRHMNRNEFISKMVEYLINRHGPNVLKDITNFFGN